MLVWYCYLLLFDAIRHSCGTYVYLICHRGNRFKPKVGIFRENRLESFPNHTVNTVDTFVTSQDHHRLSLDARWVAGHLENGDVSQKKDRHIEFVTNKNIKKHLSLLKIVIEFQLYSDLAFPDVPLTSFNMSNP